MIIRSNYGVHYTEDNNRSDIVLIVEGKKMMFVLRLIIFTVILSFAHIASAQVTNANIELNREDISSIKILGSEVDKIHFFLSCENKKVYRISNINQYEADKILKRLKSDTPLILKSHSVKNKKYMQVSEWK